MELVLLLISHGFIWHMGKSALPGGENLCFSSWRDAPAGSQRQQMPFAVTAPPVKMCLERPAGRDKHEI